MERERQKGCGSGKEGEGDGGKKRLKGEESMYWRKYERVGQKEKRRRS